MNLFAAIETYVKRKRAEGLDYGSSASYLGALSRQAGNMPLQSVTTLEILTFLDSTKASSSTWMVKYRLLRRFFDFWLARGEINALPMPVKRKISQQPFVRHVYTHSEIRALLKSARTSQGGDSQQYRLNYPSHRSDLPIRNRRSDRRGSSATDR